MPIPIIAEDRAMDIDRAKKIYKRICDANGIIFRPLLFMSNDSRPNGTAHFTFIRVTKGALISYDDDELALTLAHELVHCRKWHWLTKLWRKPHDLEFEADLEGAKLITKAKFNVLESIKKFDKMKNIRTETHPYPKGRANRLREYFWTRP